MRNDNVISYKELLADLKTELEEFEADIIELADPEKPLSMQNILERLDIIERAYYEHLIKRIKQLEQWLAVEEGREV
ncbi:hypothetical protein SAMN05660649_04331 [Desulfotomaculum arcticum]|uniref:Uncharacterized protein n=1 Tax=Desulfotruncus arcticus DSM 17038 TaxID=1121424 RepID=A0A1I2Y9R3_9FIRM|nr:hypothetical protein [Desulfotruncus arcticus]SFH22382.1 hypothetical protein SAMN05660649_04331 [Desulfotomaculum arcticum] [Desulfotruncus arcticus DSM 17038]